MYSMVTEIEEENEVSERNYQDKKTFYNREFIESANLIVGLSSMSCLVSFIA